MIPELRIGLFQRLTTPGTDFITRLGDNKVFHKRPLNNEDFPYCAFEQTYNERTIDSSYEYPVVEITFWIYDGANDGVKESTTSMTNLEYIAKYLDDLLDAQASQLTVPGYSVIDIKKKSETPAPTSSNEVQGTIIRYEFNLQKRRI